MHEPLRDVGGPGLDVLSVGINPSLRSAEVGHHFARPGNRFWPALEGAGYTPRRLRPEQDGELPSYGVGVTRAALGLQAERLGGRPVWVLPNPSGLNASWPLDRIAAEFRRLREAAAALRC